MDVRTLCELFYDSVDRYKKDAHLLHKRDGEWRGIPSAELRQAVEELSLGLRALGLERDDHVAILSENRPEWAFADLAVLIAGAQDVPIYPTLLPHQILYILKDSESKMVFVSTPQQATKVAGIRDQLPGLAQVIRMDGTPVEGTLTLEEVRERGRRELERDPEAARKRAAAVQPGDLATIIYTSGTTGDPKGVMLTHSNLVSNTKAGAKVFGLGTDDRNLSFLPLCHVFERMAGHYLMLHVGATIAYAESIDAVPQNMVEVRPTLVASVPRLYEKMYARIQERVAADPPLRRRIFQWALGVGREAFRHRVGHTTPGLLLRSKLALADALVFSKIRERTGGRLRTFVTGAAPLAREITEFFGAVGLTILEGYGLTETSPVIAVNRPESLKPGTVGQPIEGIEVKIAEDGEILTRGPHVMKGYYKKPEATAEAIDAEGWFHTGDIGVFDPQGFLVITDRKKDLIVTSGGKKVAPQPIENRVKANPLIAEIVMIGNTRNFPAALIIPNFQLLEGWARERNIPAGNREDLVQNPQVIELFESTMKDLTRDLAQFEKIKKIVLLSKEFTIESGELTPTMKVKRRVVEQKYQAVIDRLYASGGPA